ncbi:MAG: hydrogenase nickel incorporation protein HypB [Deltaproteobacteria bacterium]|nr:hydrogenase nickel incorporation protein HypB [Deltaproteobacteria bacterium]MBW2098663.1 hydrogenase nickel incorporation protein HypB [Deltaproteobacteria bacterium]
MEIKIIKKILEANEVIAWQNMRLFLEKGVYVINLMGSPGAGKTTLLERTVKHLKGKMTIGVIEGDIATSRDAERIASYAVPTVQINTGAACHLDGSMVRSALDDLDLDRIDLLIVENVGNLVCPAEFKIGENDKVMIVSVPEGDDKPLKYPLMFQVCSVLLLNKIDLLPYLDFDMKRFRNDALKVNPRLKIMGISCKTGEGLDDWFGWIEEMAGR